MAIDGGLRDRLAVGTVLAARYKGTEYRATVVEGEDGKRRYRLADGQEFKSPSSAGSAVMGGSACNGWRFWSLADGTTPAKSAKGSTKQAGKKAATKSQPKPAPQPAAKGERPRCKRCGKVFVAAKQLAHHEANADRLCLPA